MRRSRRPSRSSSPASRRKSKHHRPPERLTFKRPSRPHRMTGSIDPTVSGEPRGSFSPTLSEPFKRMTNSAAERDAERRGNMRQGRQADEGPAAGGGEEARTETVPSTTPGTRDNSDSRCDAAADAMFLRSSFETRHKGPSWREQHSLHASREPKVTTHTPALLLLSAARGCYFFIGTQRNSHFIYPSFLVGKRKKIYQ